MKYFLSAGIFFACTLAAQPKPGAGSIEGHVFNSVTKAPIRKATVVLTDSQIRLFADTDATGRFQFTGLPPGTYRLSASQAGFLEHGARRPISLGQDDHVRDATILLPPQGVITGRVLDEDGDPVGGARLWIFKQVYQNGRKHWDRVNIAVLTNETGEYRFASLTSGRYILHVFNSRPTVNNNYGDRDHPLMDYVPVYYPSARTQQAATPVEVGVGAEVRGIDIHLLKLARPRSFRLSGRVAGAPPDSEIGVGLRSLDDSASDGGGIVARPPDYTFQMNIRPGQYTLSAHVYSGGPAAYASRSLTVTGDITGLVVAMSPAPHVAARIGVAERSNPVNLQDVKVTLSRLPAYPDGLTEVRSDATGKIAFTRPIAPGHYSIEVDRRTIPDGCYLQKVTFGGQEIAADDFEILASAELEIVLSNTAGTITGSVLDGDGKPFPGSAVTVIPIDGNTRPVKQPADDDGNFKVAGLRPGKYKLFAWEEVDDAIWQDPEFRKTYESRATEVTVGPTETQNAQLRSIPVEDMK